MKIYTTLTREDALEMLKVAEQMHAESPNYKHKPFDKQRMWNLFDRTVRFPEQACMIYAKEGDEIVGGILGHMNQQYFSGDLVASDLGMFLKPEYRGSTTFVRLFKAFEQWAIDNKATSIIVGHTTGVNTDKSKGIFTRLGYNLMGYVFHKEV
jgi:hypothetical protein